MQDRWSFSSVWLSLSLLWGISWLPTLPLQDLPALAQSGVINEITADQKALFARIVLQIEPYRILALEQSEGTIDPELKAEIQRKFIRKATEIITINGMTVPDYNRITLRVRGDQGEILRQEIEAEIRALQDAGFETEENVSL